MTRPVTETARSLADGEDDGFADMLAQIEREAVQLALAGNVLLCAVCGDHVRPADAVDHDRTFHNRMREPDYRSHSECPDAECIWRALEKGATR